MKQPVLTTYDQQHLHRIALPLGGIGTGTVSLGGRGDLRDWEIMNRPAKGFTPTIARNIGPSFILNMQTKNDEPITRLCEGPLELSEYEGDMGSTAVNHGLPRFSKCSFGSAYPFGQVKLSDAKVPLDVAINAFNPLVPIDAEASGIPVAVLSFELSNHSRKNVTATLCGSLPNFIGNDGTESVKCTHRNRFRKADKFQGIFMDAEGLKPHAAQQGTIALTTLAKAGVSYRTGWNTKVGWSSSVHDFWKDLQSDGMLDKVKKANSRASVGSLAVKTAVPAGKTKKITFLITWHFPNRQAWNRPKDREAGVVGNFYTTQYKDAWDVVRKTQPLLNSLEKKTALFVESLCSSDLPHSVKEAALFNISTLRTQTCFRTPDGYLYGWEGCGNKWGCCQGSCTHVWNYEQATAFLFGELALGMRKVEFAHATDKEGCMSFRVHLPLKKNARDYGKAAADGQMGCIMKMYRDWQLSGDTAALKKLWPKVKKALAFCWIKGGWDADQDGVMEGCQHNTMDVEYFGPNPQMTGWYLGALRAAEEMAAALGDKSFAEKCRELFDNGSAWMDKNLFNGEYYEHHIKPMKRTDIAESLVSSGKNEKLSRVDFQLGKGCLVDQLVGQYMAHVCGLGYLHDKRKVAKTLKSILKYNQINGMDEHFNCMRSYVLGDEKALLMAAYPGEIPENPFPYFTEVMTGFEYTAAVGMLYEGQTKDGLKCIENIRERYDGKKRSPFDEAECGHHYARAMASWAAVLALTDFHYSAVDNTMTFAAKVGTHFWSTGYAWGTCVITKKGKKFYKKLKVLHGKLPSKPVISLRK